MLAESREFRPARVKRHPAHGCYLPGGIGFLVLIPLALLSLASLPYGFWFAIRMRSDRSLSEIGGGMEGWRTVRVER